MNRTLGYRFLIFILGAILVVVIPAFLLGPYIFHGLSLEYASTKETIGSLACGLLGAWLVVVSIFAGEEFVRITSEATQAQEAFPIVAIYLMFRGSRSIWRRRFAKGGNGAP